MSNPCINRWGMNTFWHNFWFNDFEYSVNIRQDKAITTLITTFIFYGINMSYNIFSNPYWYSKFFSKLSLKTYQRWITYIPKGKEVLAETYSIRQEADCIFPMKLWILKYSHWVIINQYWFNPFKGRRRKIKLLENPNHIDSCSLKKQYQLKSVRRLQTIIQFNTFLKKKPLYYVF